MKKVAIHNLGCKVNSYESESMELLLKNAGYEIVPFDENIKADIYIINTCSVTNIADRKSRQMLHKAKKLNKDAIVVAAGCYVQADSEGVKKDEAVDIVLGNNMKINIVEALDNYYKDKGKDSYVTDLSHNTNYENLNIDKVNEHTRAYIKIQDGCNQFCSYCIIPYVRGRIRSRDTEDIISEVERLSLNGYKEIVLTGIHLSSYGVDNNKGSLIEVIEALHKIDGIERIRLGSLEPRIITDDFVMRLSKLDKVCPHFHLSLQSGCDKTLKDMNRKYTTQEYMTGCDLLRKYYDNPAITTDVIVGFPGETEEDFNTTKNFLEKIKFYEMHIFKYSRRKGTVADRMSNQIDDRIKTDRSGELLKLEKEMSAEYRKGYVGSSMKVLVEEKTEINNEEYYTGHTKNYIKVMIKGKDIDSLYGEASAINEILNVKIVDINHNGDMLIGQIDWETEVEK
ncbi:MAG: tRNA (N(6)-L-threonylcarbamoyladenosine(37)-C(2))-methylthiotransferase MtaB [Lachnospira sp.]